jgi:hypothetical protein
VINLSSVTLEDAVYSALGEGLNYAISLVVLPIDGILTGVEKAIVFLLILFYFFYGLFQ